MTSLFRPVSIVCVVKIVVVSLILFEGYSYCGEVLLGVRLEGVMAYTRRKRVSTWTSHDGCVGLESIEKQILFSLSIITTPWATFPYFLNCSSLGLPEHDCLFWS